MEIYHQRKEKKKYSKNIPYTEQQIGVLFTDSFSTKLFVYDELSTSSGLFYYSSFISHSCDPNINILGIGNFIFILAERNIQKNEELTTFYIDNDKEFTKRQNDLFLNYGFKCQCSLCQIERDNFSNNFQVKAQISNFINKLIEMSVNMLSYSYFDYMLIIEEVNLFIDLNKDIIKNFEKGLLYYNLYYIWKDSKFNIICWKKLWNALKKKLL